jgi:hypothetical protein
MATSSTSRLHQSLVSKHRLIMLRCLSIRLLGGGAGRRKLANGTTQIQCTMPAHGCLKACICHAASPPPGFSGPPLMPAVPINWLSPEGYPVRNDGTPDGNVTSWSHVGDGDGCAANLLGWPSVARPDQIAPAVYSTCVC